MSKQDSIASCLAKMYESKLEQSTGPGKSVRKGPEGVNNLDKKLNLLNEKMDKLLHFQEDVMGQLEIVHHGMDMLEKGMDILTAFRGPTHEIIPEVGLNPSDDVKQGREQSACSELMRLLKMMHEDSVVHREKLDSLEKMVSTMDKVVAFVGNTLRNSKIVEFILKGTVPWKRETKEQAKDKTEEKEAKAKNGLGSGQKSSADTKKGSTLEDNRGLSQKTSQDGSTHALESALQTDDRVCSLETSKPLDNAQVFKTCTQKMEGQKSEGKGAHIATEAQHSWTDPNRVTEQRACQPEHYKSTWKTGNTHSSACSNISNSLETTDPNDSMLLPRADTSAQAAEITDVTQMNQGRITKESSNRQLQDSVNHKTVFHGSDNSQEAKDKRPSLIPKIGKVQMSCIKNTKCMKSQESCEKKSVVHQKKQAEDLGKGCNETHSIIHGGKERAESQKGQLPKRESDRNLTEDQPHGSTLSEDTNTELEESSLHVIDDCPPPPAPFNHRIVSIKQAILSSCYTVCQHEVLGGGRFGQVHKCVEKASGLRLAAKIIKVKGAKDRDEVKNEITVMNQLNHVNLIQLYDAFECKNDLTLIMEYLDGGELFDRITDENYNLTELDAIMFTKQICEGIYYLHQQYILHLDLKPENILCVSQTGNQIKIIDFGLARRYKPREKLKVNFGTPEFLAPEVVNYDFVSFPTDMWSVGVITYMLLSGLSPFLGESDAETMNYIVNCSWDFDADTFEQVSDEAKDFISRLLIKEKSCRLSAGQCLKHDWLVNLPLKAKKYKVRLKSQVMLQKYMAQRKWKKHFYVVAAANRLRKFQLLSLKPT